MSVAIEKFEPIAEPVMRVELGVVRGERPADLVAHATEAANALAGVIEAKKLYSNIQGRKFVKCEGWTTLATMMGCLAREASMTRREDGSYEAVVELVRITDGTVLTRASAECGMDEPTWSKRSAYARRSMAATRATSKACRLAFSWVMALAGYEVTPSEEIPEEERTAKPVAKPAQPLTEKPAALSKPEDALPFEPLTRETPCPHTKQRATLASLTKQQLLKLEIWLAENGNADRAEDWMALVQSELKQRSEAKE